MKHATLLSVAAPLLTGLLLTSGCVAGPKRDRPEPLRGQVRNLEDPTTAVVEVYRARRGRPAVRVPFPPTVPGTGGGFVTPAVPRGDYLVVLRMKDRPPAFSTARVPGPRIALTALPPPAGAATIEIRAATSSQTAAVCTLVQADPSGPIADRRSIGLRGGAPIIVGGLVPGRWWLDVPWQSASLELVLLGGQAVAERVVVSPPAAIEGAALTGRVTHRGSPVEGVVVAVRPVVEGYGRTRSWGRYAVTESDGGYRIDGISEGPAVIRVESHDGPIRLPPAPLPADIPPSGELARDFEIGL